MATFQVEVVQGLVMPGWSSRLDSKTQAAVAAVAAVAAITVVGPVAKVALGPMTRSILDVIIFLTVKKPHNKLNDEISNK